MAGNNQRDAERLAANLNVSDTRSSRVRMVPAGGHFAAGDGSAPVAPATVGGAAAGRRFRQRTAMDEEEPRPAGARYADPRPQNALSARSAGDGGELSSPRPAGSRFSTPEKPAAPASVRVPVVPKHGAPEKPDAASVTTASIDISDSHAATEPLSHGSEVLAAPKPADTAEFTAAAALSAPPKEATRALGGAATLLERRDPLGAGVFQEVLVQRTCRQERKGKGEQAGECGRRGRSGQGKGAARLARRAACCADSYRRRLAPCRGFYLCEGSAGISRGSDNV